MNAGALRDMTPWTDRAGSFSLLKAAVLAGLCLPALLLALSAAQGTLVPAGSPGLLGARPITEAIHETGDWAIRFLCCRSPSRRCAASPTGRSSSWCAAWSGWRHCSTRSPISFSTPGT